MNQPKYYTDAEMFQRMNQLLNQGKGLYAIVNDPRCQPEMRDKLKTLQNIELKEGGQS